MKRSSEFSEPRRQSQWAIVFIVLRFMRRLVMQLWPILLAAVLGRRGGAFDRYEMIGAAIGGVGMVSSVLSYYFYYYYVSDEELIIKKGILKKVKLDIPFERIQSINFRQTVIHRFLQVTELELETAGSKEQETKIDALSIPQAERLKQLLLDRRAQALKASNNALSEGEVAIELQEDTRHTILTLSSSDILRVGLTQNHLAPVGLIIGFAFSAMFYAFTFDIEVQEIIDAVWTFGSSLSLMEMVGGGLLIAVVSVVFSIVTSFLKYHNLSFWRSGERFQVVQGLFTRREFAALDRKIQILNWGQNPLERWLDLTNIKFSQATSDDGKKGKMQFEIPGCDDNRLDYVKREWLGYIPQPMTTLSMISKHYFWHFLFYAVAIGIPILAGLIYAEAIRQFVVALLVIILLISFRWRAYKKKIFGYNKKELYIGGGVLGHRHSLLPLYKVQNVSIEQNPYQWRRNLSNLNVYTAAGTIRIPYIDRSTAVEVMDHLLYHAELSRRKWM